GGGAGWAGGTMGVATCAKAGAEAAMSTSPMNVGFIGLLPGGPNEQVPDRWLWALGFGLWAGPKAYSQKAKVSLRGFRLRVEHRVIHRLIGIELRFVSGGIDIRVRALSELRVFLSHVVHARVRAERDITRQRAADLERARVLLGDLWNVLVVDQLKSRIHAET